MLKLPWVSRRAYELLESSIEELRRERNEYREQADRAKDELINRCGFAPVSSPVREELKQVEEELKKYEDSLQLEDLHSGMISDEVEQLASDLAAPSDKPV